MVAQAPSKPKLETAELRGVEILSVGHWNGDDYTAADLQAMADAFDALKGKIDPVLKLGHDKDQALAQKDGFPSLGWATDLRVEGKKLLADFTKVPRKVADLIQAGAYDKVSAEVYFDREIDGKTYPRVLKAVALLGADAPAVKDIASISDVADLYKDQFPQAEAHYAEYSVVPESKRGDMPASDFVFADTRSFPILDASDVGDAVSSWGRYKGSHSFDDFKRRLTAIAKRKGFASSLPKEWTNTAKKNSERKYDWGDDLPPTTVGVALTTAMEQVLQQRLMTFARYSVISDDEEDAVYDIFETLEDGFEAAVDAAVFGRPVTGKLASGMYADDDELGEDEALADLTAYLSRLEDRIKGVAGAPRLRTFLGVALRQLGDMKLRPAASNGEQDMTTKELAEMLGLPETATDAEVKAEIEKMRAATGKVGELSEAVRGLQEERLKERAYAEVDTAIQAGKVVPAQKDAMRKYALADPEGFKQLVDSTPRFSFLSAPVGSDSDAGEDAEASRTPVQESVSKQLGVTPEMRERAKKSVAELMEENARKVAATAR